jgi:hypothetical protein
MADIDRRVRILTDTLMDRGFGWLAAEIIEAIERGRDSADNHDPYVSAQRTTLNQKLSSGEADAVSTAESLKYSATRPEIARERFNSQEQILVAVAIFVDRLSSAADMTSQSLDELSALMDTTVSLSIETEGEEVRTVLPAKARDAAIGLREIESQLIHWLISTAPPEGA